MLPIDKIDQSDDTDHDDVDDPFSTDDADGSDSGEQSSRRLVGDRPALKATSAAGTAAERQQDHLDALLAGDDVAELPTRQLRVLANHAFKLLDGAYPPACTADIFALIIEELDAREKDAAQNTSVKGRESFRDNPLYTRFELFVDGTIAAYLKYAMNGGRLFLIHYVERPEFEGQGYDETLMRYVILNAHKRRLSVITQSGTAFGFTASNPQYRNLTTQPSRLNPLKSPTAPRLSSCDDRPLKAIRRTRNVSPTQSTTRLTCLPVPLPATSSSTTR